MTATPGISYTPQATQSHGAGNTPQALGHAKAKGTGAPSIDFLTMLLGMNNIDGEGALLTTPDAVPDKTADTLQLATQKASENAETLTEEFSLPGLNAQNGFELALESLPSDDADNATQTLLKLSIAKGNGLADAAHAADLENGEISLPTNKLEELSAYLDSLLSGMPADSRINIKLKTGTETGKDSSPLIATGMTVEELTALIKKLEQEDTADTSILAGMIKILPPKPAQTEKPVTFKGNGAGAGIDLANLKAATQQAAASGDAAAAGAENAKNQNAKHNAFKLNALLANSGETAENQDPSGLTETAADGKSKASSTILDLLEQAQQKSSGKNNAAKGLENALQNIDKQAGQNLQAGGSAFDGGSLLPPGLEGMVFDSGLSGEVFPDGIDWSTGQLPNGKSMNINSPALLTSLVNMARHASQPHPAIKTIAANISKSAGKDGTQNFRVRLNPPELGQVEIRMEITKDKTAKVHILAEKQDTFLMLQRDAQILERAMQDAGLDTNNGSLSFELAENGSLFDDGSHGRGGQNASGGGNSGDADDGALEVIETSVDWYIDPQTGMTRYDILA